MLANLPLQVLLYFNGWFDAAYCFILLVLYIWKGTTLPYPVELHGLMVLEVILVFVYAGIEYARLFLATRGNKTETPGPLIISAVFSLGSIALLIYTLLLQIYVTRADVILSGIGLGFVGLELLLSVLAMLTFMRAPPGHAGS